MTYNLINKWKALQNLNKMINNKWIFSNSSKWMVAWIWMECKVWMRWTQINSRWQNNNIKKCNKCKKHKCNRMLWLWMSKNCNINNKCKCKQWLSSNRWIQINRCKCNNRWKCSSNSNMLESNSKNIISIQLKRMNSLCQLISKLK